MNPTWYPPTPARRRRAPNPDVDELMRYSGIRPAPPPPTYSRFDFAPEQPDRSWLVNLIAIMLMALLGAALIFLAVR